MSPYPSALLSGLDLGDIVSCDCLDDLSKIRNLPIGDEHAVRGHAHGPVHERLLVGNGKVVRVVCGHVAQHVPRGGG